MIRRRDIVSLCTVEEFREGFAQDKLGGRKEQEASRVAIEAVVLPGGGLGALCAPLIEFTHRTVNGFLYRK